VKHVVFAPSRDISPEATEGLNDKTNVHDRYLFPFSL